jgi:hypothetical protein
MNDQIIAIVRTVVPTLVGAFAAFLLATGVELDDETKSAMIVALTGIFSGAYYAIIRSLASKVPSAGWLLGYPANPAYGTSNTPEPVAKTSTKSKTGAKK